MSAMNEATPSSTPTATKRPVGRPRKYEDDEQRLEAKRKSARESYHRNKHLQNTIKLTDGTNIIFIDKNDENAYYNLVECGHWTVC